MAVDKNMAEIEKPGSCICGLYFVAVDCTTDVNASVGKASYHRMHAKSVLVCISRAHRCVLLNRQLEGLILVAFYQFFATKAVSRLSVKPH